MEDINEKKKTAFPTAREGKRHTTPLSFGEGQGGEAVVGDSVARFFVSEIFYSLQGEGRWTGRAAIFVRFSGCNLRCPFCDTDFSRYREMTEEEIIDAVGQWPQCKFIVFTGGEPTLQLTDSLVAKLKARGYFMTVETNGTHPVPEGIDWITCSPKTAFVNNDALRITRCDEVKVVYDGIHAISDYGLDCRYRYVQPCDTGDAFTTEANLRGAIAYVQQHPQWQLSLQVHKILKIQ